MPEYNYDMLGTSTDIEWPKRGRKKKPLPEALVKALQDSFTNETVPHMILPNEQVKSFATLLGKIGQELNMRIERHSEVDTPKSGYTTYHFRARSKRNKEL